MKSSVLYNMPTDVQDAILNDTEFGFKTERGVY
jgi:hypothetical protein